MSEDTAIPGVLSNLIRIDDERIRGMLKPPGFAMCSAMSAPRRGATRARVITSGA